MGDEPIPDPATWIFGDYNKVYTRVGIEGEAPTAELIQIALESSDNYIISALQEANLPMPTKELMIDGITTDYPVAIREAATYNAVADALIPLFNNNEDANQKVLLYQNMADSFLIKYINAQALKNQNELNPYLSVLADPRDDIENLDLTGD